MKYRAAGICRGASRGESDQELEKELESEWGMRLAEVLGKVEQKSLEQPSAIIRAGLSAQIRVSLRRPENRLQLNSGQRQLKQDCGHAEKENIEEQPESERWTSVGMCANTRSPSLAVAMAATRRRVGYHVRQSPPQRNDRRHAIEHPEAEGQADYRDASQVRQLNPDARQPPADEDEIDRAQHERVLRQ